MMVPHDPMPASDIVQDAAILDAINGGIIVFDCDERIVAWNAWMASASGHRSSGS